MPSQVISSVENNFTKGLITESTGLNFPENAATECDNIEFTLIGTVNRRRGYDYEDNFALQTIDRNNQAVNTYKWNNVAGDGTRQLLVTQIGGQLEFWDSSIATTANPLSTKLLGSTINISSFTASGLAFDTTKECQFSDGNGYLFVYHPSCNPFYVTYSAGTLVGTSITVQIRDFEGISEGASPDNTRPLSLTASHQYNLQNQGWGKYWFTNSFTTNNIEIGTQSFVVTSNTLPISAGDVINLAATGGAMTAVVVSYTGFNLVVTSTITAGTGTFSTWTIRPTQNFIEKWQLALGNFPSNVDVWTMYKDNTDNFNPTVTFGNVQAGLTPAPKGSIILNAFNQQRSSASQIPGIPDVQISVRPRIGTWFQGRVWYSGVDAQGFSNNIYFSQVIETPAQFGRCYQTNDPTSETLFDILPTDGGVIRIQDCGTIYKLFPIQNGMIVFATNGVWFITGSQGIGFAAQDYTITKLSQVQCVSSSSFVNVQGLPYFWNEEGIYQVTPSDKGNGLVVQSLTVGTILSFYMDIPLSSKLLARGDYDPVNYTIQWIYKNEDAVTVNDRYEFDRILNFNTYNKAFYPYTVGDGTPAVSGINYITNQGGVGFPIPSLKYLTTLLSPGQVTFSEEKDNTYFDWKTNSIVGVDYESFFVTGYKVHGQAQRKFQIPYIYMFSFSDNDNELAYKIQGLWDYASTSNSNRWSVPQIVQSWKPNFNYMFKKHRIRGRGLVLQIKVSSVSGQPFSLLGWSTYEAQNTGI